MSIKKTKPHFNNEFFEEIDASSEKSNYFSPVLQEVSNIIDYKKSKILDVGCGTGIFLESIIEDGSDNCFGIDGPSDFHKKAKKNERGYVLTEVKSLCKEFSFSAGMLKGSLADGCENKL